MNLAEKIIHFNKNLSYKESLPNNFSVLNPYLDNPETLDVMSSFYHKFYNDTNKRKFIIGINPSRHGAGVTGVPFTDTKRLESECGIQMQTAHTHEVSSVFMYNMIREFGGVYQFYSKFYINSPFPLAIIRQTSDNKWVNANYYDDLLLFEKLKPFMIETLKKHINLGLDTDKVYILGKKNASFLSKINKEIHLFEQMIVLEHPRYIQQYKSKEQDFYIDKFLTEFYK
jgi:hypothetical protein